MQEPPQNDAEERAPQADRQRGFPAWIALSATALGEHHADDPRHRKRESHRSKEHRPVEAGPSRCRQVTEHPPRVDGVPFDVAPARSCSDPSSSSPHDSPCRLAEHEEDGAQHDEGNRVAAREGEPARSRSRGRRTGRGACARVTGRRGGRGGRGRARGGGRRRGSGRRARGGRRRRRLRVQLLCHREVGRRHRLGGRRRAQRLDVRLTRAADDEPDEWASAVALSAGRPFKGTTR